MNPELIETMLSDAQGHIALWDLHMQRLQRSSVALDRACPDPQQISGSVQCELQKVIETQTLNPMPSAHAGHGYRVRLLLGIDKVANVSVAAMTPMPDTPKIVTSSFSLDSFEFWLQHKTTYRPWYVNATQWLATHPDYFDVVYGNERGELCEGSRSNVYLKIDGQWLTPPLKSGLLGGVWRQKLLEQGQVKEASIPLSYLERDVPIRLSNGLRGWFDVRLDHICQAI